MTRGNTLLTSMQSIMLVFHTTESHSNLSPRGPVPHQQVIAIAGSSAQLDCMCRGHPSPSYYWFRTEDNSLLSTQPISSSYSSFHKKVLIIYGSLIIRPVSVGDSNKYVCICNNTLGHDRQEVDLLVRGMSVPMIISTLNLFLPYLFSATIGDSNAESCVGHRQHFSSSELFCFGLTRGSSGLEVERNDNCVQQ